MCALSMRIGRLSIIRKAQFLTWQLRRNINVNIKIKVLYSKVVLFSIILFSAVLYIKVTRLFIFTDG